MPRLKLVTDSDPILRSPNHDLSFPLTKEMRDLAGEMIFACKKFNGVGLAAPQIGRNLNLAVICLAEYEIPPFPIINPKIISRSRRQTPLEEGCLSIPNKFGIVLRPEKITVKFQTLEGESREVKLDGFIAKVFQHEIDHLGGILIADKWDPQSVHMVTAEDRERMRRARRQASDGN